MDSREFAEWLALESVEPWGSVREDWQAALIAATIANVYRKPGSPPIEVREFLLRFRRATVEPKRASQIERALKRWAKLQPDVTHHPHGEATT